MTKNRICIAIADLTVDEKVLTQLFTDGLESYCNIISVNTKSEENILAEVITVTFIPLAERDVIKNKVVDLIEKQLESVAYKILGIFEED